MGRYEVRFNGSPGRKRWPRRWWPDQGRHVSVTNTGPGLFTVYVLDPLPAPGAFVDDGFTMITP